MPGAKKHAAGLCLLGALAASPLLIIGNYNISAAGVTLPASRYLDNVDSQMLVIFAGFIGCSDYCPASLTTLSGVLDSLPDKSLTVAFLNIVRGTPDSISDEYAKSIDKRFVGLSVPFDENQARMFYQKFGIVSGHDAASVRNHSSRIYLFKRSGSDEWILTDTQDALSSRDTYARKIAGLL